MLQRAAPPEFSFHQEEVLLTRSPPLYDNDDDDDDDKYGDDDDKYDGDNYEYDIDDKKASFYFATSARGCKTTWLMLQTQWTTEPNLSKYIFEEDVDNVDNNHFHNYYMYMDNIAYNVRNEYL